MRLHTEALLTRDPYATNGKVQRPLPAAFAVVPVPGGFAVSDGRNHLGRGQFWGRTPNAVQPFLSEAEAQIEAGRLNR